MTLAGIGQRRERPIDDNAGLPTSVSATAWRRWPGYGARLAHWLWHDRTIQWQLLATVLLISLVTGLMAGASVIYNAHDATAVEVAASMEVAEQVIGKTIDQLTLEGSGLHASDKMVEDALTALPLRLLHLRHVRISLSDPTGRPLAEAAPDAGRERGTAAPAAPRWFGALVRLDTIRRQVPVVIDGRQVATVLLTSQPDDELAEVWKDVSGLAAVVLAANIAVIGLFYLALGRLLKPLTSVAAGLRELQQGRFGHRLERPRVRDLADIVDRFNALAGALEAARADNARLNRRLLTAQDDERREIATELHDELGACLFGLRANVLSVQRLAHSLPPDAGDQMRKRAATLVEVSERIQATNRHVLGRLRPMALGHAPLGEVIAGLVADFERHDPEHAFSLDIGRLRRSYGDCIDLTVYRCLQEGITNAVRHAEARTVCVRLDEKPASPAAASPGTVSSPPALRLSVRDDGRGVLPGATLGLGLTGMEKRVSALGGSFAIADGRNGGTWLDIAIPVDEAEAGEPAPMDMQVKDGRA